MAHLGHCFGQVPGRRSLLLKLLGKLYNFYKTLKQSFIPRYADIYAASVLNLLYYPTFYMFRSPAMLLPHESTVSHEHPVEQQDSRRRLLVEARGEGGGVASGQEPSHTHDMDDDEIDEMEEAETNSDQSN